jgi:hypothetical protein
MCQYPLNILKIERTKLQEKLALSQMFSTLVTEIAFPLIID